MTNPATLLANAKQQFVDINGAPLASGTVEFYVPNSLTPKDTWQNAGMSILNTNPVTLDARGQAIIYGSGQYRQIVRDSLGNLIWDQLTQDIMGLTTDFATQDYVQSLLSSLGTIIPGSIQLWGGSSAPSGYLECDGSAISRAVYSSLFAAVGTLWGVGDGSSTFNVPDFRGYFVRGWDHSRGVDSGRAVASYQTDAFKSHTHSHTLTDPGHVGHADGTGVNATGFWTGEENGAPPNSNLQARVTTGITLSISNSGGSETRPINAAAMYIIKT